MQLQQLLQEEEVRQHLLHTCCSRSGEDSAASSSLPLLSEAAAAAAVKRKAYVAEDGFSAARRPAAAAAATESSTIECARICARLQSSVATPTTDLSAAATAAICCFLLSLPRRTSATPQLLLLLFLVNLDGAAAAAAPPSPAAALLAQVLLKRGKMYSLFINNKHGSLVYQRNFSPEVRLSANDAIRLASTFHGLSAIAAQLSPAAPRGRSSALSFLQPRGISLVEADDFKLHCLETLTGLKFALVAELSTPHATVEAVLRRVYEAYSDYVLKNPFYDLDMPVRCQLFDREIDVIFADYIVGSP